MSPAAKGADHYAVELEQISWSPGHGFSIDDLSLRVPRGSVYGFLGPNGSGKTSTIRILMGMVRPTSGTVRLAGRRLPKQLPEALALTGYVPERPHLYPNRTVAETLDFHGAFHPRWDRHWADQLVGRLGLVPGRRVERLSKGEKGKLMITLALGQRPELLVLDEPTDGLDPVVRRDVLEAVLDYVGDTGATVFISSHLVHELERICDWVGVMDQGRLVAEMPMHAFRNGIKKLRVEVTPNATPEPGDRAPFRLLHRQVPNGVSPHETWVVQGWTETHRLWFDQTGHPLHDVIDLDLEDGFVELLRASRTRLRLMED